MTTDGDAAPRWLVVGHGSVGSFVARRLADAGAAVDVFDPAPRLPIVAGTAVVTMDRGVYDCTVSCVPPDAAPEVAETSAAALVPGGLFFDWNTVAPEVKRRIAAAAGAGTVDVALLDSVDGASRRPRLAVSGPAAGRGAELLTGVGFDVVVAGPEVGQAAALKYLRSVFMKTLEALVLEFSALASELDPNDIVRDSLTNNLGTEFAAFMDLLLTTNRVHAERRAHELDDAVASFTSDGTRPELAEAAAELLHRAALAWQDGAPGTTAAPEELARFLHDAFWDAAAARP